jgi:glycosyltransferase involved in cell wall biosynthesis
VKEQTMAPLEIIVIDDASADNTVAVIENLIAGIININVRLIKHQTNQGAAIARNTGWDLAQGDLIAFLDADDSWHPRKLELQASWMTANNTVQVSGHAYEIAETKNCIALSWPETIHFDHITSFSFDSFLTRNRLSTPTVMLRRSIRERFPTNKRFCEDYDLWLQLSHNYGVCAWSQAKLARLYKNPWGVSGLSADLWSMYAAEKQCYRDCFQKKWISRLSLLWLEALSTAKHARRLIKKTFGKISY